MAQNTKGQVELVIVKIFSFEGNRLLREQASSVVVGGILGADVVFKRISDFARQVQVHGRADRQTFMADGSSN